jgi:SAM-dependent methyltransferase
MSKNPAPRWKLTRVPAYRFSVYKLHHIVRELAANAAMSVPSIRDARVKRGRTAPGSLEAKARMIRSQFEFFMDAIGTNGIRGKTVLEIGPGDAVPLAPLFLRAGARRYVALDRFLGDVTNERALDLCHVALAGAPPEIGDRATLRRLLQTPSRVTLIKAAIEDEAPLNARGADFIISFNVCEHLGDLRKALRNMTALLAPGGRMIHRVDYGPHDVWEGYDNPLAFLTVPQPLWRMMSGSRGCPNRTRHAQLVSMARALGLQVVDRVGTCAPESSVAQVRPYLSKEFRDLRDAELGVLDAQIICGFGPFIGAAG